ncbi:uncharacterized protein LOC134228900 isoform X1 [Saccostrea cucullata]|uniref:uncharacterized protein LOC134228900 isoform X1 n=2 Tax=Saccostrea cuccullata TaxID=36930 RepID=UPI002ED35B39
MTGIFIQWIVAFVFAVVSTKAQSTLIGNIKMKGVTGNVTLTQSSQGQAITVTTSLSGLNQSNTMIIREARLLYDGSATMCSDDRLGRQMGTFSATVPSSGTSTNSISDGTDIRDLTGRSVVLTDTTNPNSTVCTTLESSETHFTASAIFPSNIAGKITFRQASSPNNAPMSMCVDLYRVTDTDNTTVGEFSWEVFTKSVSADTSIVALSQRCSNIGSLDTDLTSTHGKLSVSLQQGQNVRCFVDKSLTMQSLVGKSLAIKSSDGTIVSCGTIRQVMKRSTMTRFSRDGVKGYIKFSQESMYDPTTVDVNVTGLQSLAGGYHIHKWPVPQKLTKMEKVCDPSYVSGHFNPNNIDVNTSPSPGTGTPDQYEIGDISGKFGVLNGKSDLVDTFTDYNLPLYGMHSVIGRSIVIHKQSGGARWVCANIESTEEMRIAQITFTYPYIGYMVFQQPLMNWYQAETQIYVELDMMTQTGQSTDHKWHVHEKMVGMDSLDSTGRCSSTAGHYNPYQVDLEGNYASQCSSSNPLRCEVGDVANKHGNIDIGTSAEGKQRYFFTDVDLPLSGPLSIIGKSVVIHGANKGGERMSCGNIYELPKRVVKVDKWSQMVSSSMGGYVKLTEDSAGCLSGVTTTEINLNNLASQASGLHVHEYPVPTGSDSPCSPASVGGHFNPFEIDVNTSPANGAGTDDQYEIGDLSGRYGSPLNGKTSIAMTDMDTNVPLRGPLSVVGRSIVIHKADSSRWLCGDIMEDTEVTKGVMYKAKATFASGDIQGTITLMQYAYPGGGMSDTDVLVDLYYAQNRSKITSNHNWHVHENQVTTDCASTGGHYNPFQADLQNNYDECSFSNPLRCELGDQASKLGQYDIGNGRRFYTDVYLPLMGQFGVISRSFVVHAENGGASRVTCANIMPLDGMTMPMSFPVQSNFNKETMRTKIAAALGTQTFNLMVEQMPSNAVVDGNCMQATVYFMGPESRSLYSELGSLMKQNSNLLGAYAPCSGSNSLHFSIVLFGLLFCIQQFLSKWR